MSRPLAALVLLLLTLLTCLPLVAADERDKLKVGLQADGRIVVPTNQILQPAGTQVTFFGRPVDLLLIDDGRLLVAKNMRDLVFIDPATGAIKQTLALPAAAKGLAGASARWGSLPPAIASLPPTRREPSVSRGRRRTDLLHGMVISRSRRRAWAARPIPPGWPSRVTRTSGSVRRGEMSCR
jgi:hypothetical protein